VHCCSHHFRKQAAGRAAAVDPPEEARMTVAHAVRQDQVDKLGAGLGGSLAMSRQRLCESMHDLGRHRRPYRTLAYALNVFDGPVEEMVGKRAEFGPVGGIEALLGLARSPGGAGHARTLTGFCQYSLPSPFSAAEG